MFAVKIGARVGEGSGSMKRLLVAAALAPLSFAAMSYPNRAQADTSVSTATTAPLATSTSGNITITSSGSIKPTAGPAAVTMDGNGSVAVNSGGVISYNGVGNATDPASGILVNGGAVGNVTNLGNITLTETTTGDSTNQGITTGPFANGSNRFGIQVTGNTAFTGSISNTGGITVVGENSAGIAIGTEMTGALTQLGTITVTGGSYASGGGGTNNDISYGIHATGKIDGNVLIGGTVKATGQNAVGVALGDVGGGVMIEGPITATGYRSITPSSTDPDIQAKLNPDQTLKGGPAVEIGGNVAGGVTVAAAIAGNVSGNVSAVPAGVLTVYGSAPAMLIGGNGNASMTLGANTNGYSLEIGGSVSANGEYNNVSATGIQIGGANPLTVPVSGVSAGDAFGAVILGHGISVSGTLTSATTETISGNADSTALDIGSGAVVGNTSATGLTVTGAIAASAHSNALVGNAAGGAINEGSVTDPNKAVPITVSAIKVEAGGTLTTINNSGVITAAINGIPATLKVAASGGTQGDAVAINDQSGSVTSVVNTNTIFASVTPIVSGASVDAAHSDAVAMYLANSVGNVSVVQQANGNSTITPSITGAVILGNVSLVGGTVGNITVPNTITGAESLDIEAGTLTGAVVFNGAGANTLTVKGNGTIVTGALSQSASGTLSLNIDNGGELKMTAPTSNKLGGNGNATTINSVNINVGATGKVIFALDPNMPGAGNTSQFNVSGNATFADGAKVGVTLLSKLETSVGVAEDFTLIHAVGNGTLTVGNITTGFSGSLPFLYDATVAQSGNYLNVAISRKSATELNFNPAQTSAYEAIYSQMSEDPAIEADLLSKTNRADLLHVYNQFLPDYAGGPFDSIATGQRALARAEADAPVKLQTNQTRGWVQEIGYLANRDSSSLANGYAAKGFGLAGGVEHARGDSAIGVAAAFITTAVDNATQTSDASLSTTVIEGGVYWRKGGEGLNMSASVNGGYVSLGSHRLLLDQSSAGAVTLLRDAESSWSGALGSAQFGISYQMTMGRFYMRPEASADFIALYETSHSEHGGGNPKGPGDGFDLGINSRFNKEAAVQADLVFGYSFGEALRWRPEMTIGYREIVYGGPASTTAHFLSGGSAFTLNPGIGDRGGLLARLGVRASGAYADITADAGGEFRNGYQTYDARAVARFLF
jgi:hypothetical protein